MDTVRKIDMIVVHCSDTPEDNPQTARNEEMDIGVEEIEDWHRSRAEKEPWSHFMDANGDVRYIGYHYVVRRAGVVEAGRPLNVAGCHAKGVNKSSIGVCWVGRAHMTDSQKRSLVALVAQLCIEHGLSALDVYGHNQFSQNKTCPNFNSQLTFESIDRFRSVIEMAIRDIK
jgi:N-acetylmuramoyl-L-alanine amidase